MNNHIINILQGSACCKYMYNGYRCTKKPTTELTFNIWPFGNSDKSIFIYGNYCTECANDIKILLMEI
jgi:hypothetical protein